MSLLLNSVIIEKTNNLMTNQQQKNIEAIYPLSPMQQGMLFHTLYAPDSGVYFEQTICTLTGDLDVNAFQEAWQRVVDRHPALRTLFVWGRRTTPLQLVRNSVKVPWKMYDWRDWHNLHFEQQDLIQTVLEHERKLGFDLHRPPLIRCVLIRVEDNAYRFIWNQHHLLMDGWCLSIVLRDMLAFYDALCRGEELQLEPLPTYKNYISWLKNQDTSKAEAYWKQNLNGFSTHTPIMIDKAKNSSVEVTPHYQEHRARFSVETTAALQSMAKSYRITLNTLVQGAWALLLARYSGQDDVLFGATVSGRPPELSGVESMVGVFINTLPVRVAVPEGASLVSWLQQLQTQQVKREQYAYSPLVDIQQWSEIPAGQSLFETLVVFENYPLDVSLESCGENVKISDIHSFERTNYPLTLVIIPGSKLSLTLSYDITRFDAPAIARLAEHFKTLLQAMLVDATQQLSSLAMLTQYEQNQLLIKWNDTATTFSEHRYIHQLFEHQVTQFPESAALVFEGQRLSYKELNQHANQLAHYLQQLGVGADTLVGICVERSLEMVVSMLGVLKAGGAYVPLDSTYPHERLNFMLEDAGVKVLLTQQKLKDLLPQNKAPTVYLDTDWQKIARQRKANPVNTLNPDNLAYVIYTSGSTGKPKGVLVTHRGICNLVYAQSHAFDVKPASRVLQFASFSFDASVSEVFMALGSGAGLYLATATAILPGPDLVSLLNQYAITHITLPPSVLALLPVDGIDTLQTIITAGEACSQDIVKRWSHKYRLYNAYGPTEITVCATIAQCDDDGLAPPIGYPMANTSSYILDKQLRPIPVGVPGELHIGGIGLARGYHQRPQLTAEKFITHPFSDDPDARLYKTGDLACYREDGNICFLGRLDDQIKVRGYRIEPAEIEQVLRQHPQVEQAVVLANTNENNGDKGLAAYFTAKQGIELWPSIAEFYVYDDVVYHAMSTHESRNQRYLATFKKILQGKIAVEIGPGSEAVLSLLAIEAGAEKVYAIELLEPTYRKALQAVKSAGLEQRIILIHGDATQVVLPEKVDYCLSEIVGSIGGSEGAAKIINNARRFLKQPQCMIPQRSLTKFAAITLSENEIDFCFPEIAARYVDKIFQQVGSKFDLRLCLKNLPRDHLISTADVFEDLDYTTEIAMETQHEFSLQIEKAAVFNGLLVWLTLYTDENNVVDIFDDQHSWLPVYFPVFLSGVQVSPGDVVQGTIRRDLCKNGLNPDYFIQATIIRQNDENIRFQYAAPHFNSAYKGSEFYARLFTGDEIPIKPNLSTEGLHSHLKEFVPEYMIPSRFHEMSQLPLSPNGKIDQTALRATDVGYSIEQELVAPRDALEKQMVQIWQSILDVRPIGINHNFFELGGHSLLAVRLMAEIQNKFNKDLPLALLFQCPTIKQLANSLRGSEQTLSWPSLVPIQPQGSAIPIFCVPGNGGNVVYFYDLGKQLESDQPFYGLQAVGLDGEAEPHTRMEDMAAHYIKELQAVQAQGPYILAGHSFGSWVAFEMAQQLQKDGHEVAQLYVLDTPAPSNVAEPIHVYDDNVELLTTIADLIGRLFDKPLDISNETLQQLDSDQQLDYFEECLRKSKVFPFNLRSGQVRGLVQVFKATSEVVYTPQCDYATPITLFRAEQGNIEETAQASSEPVQNNTWGWEKFSYGAVSVYITPGDHISMMTQPHVATLAKQLKSCQQQFNVPATAQRQY